jgi:hypothetical protein
MGRRVLEALMIGMRLKPRQVKLLISLLGAVIVFGTFLARDTRRDKLKDLVDSIESAENAYLIRMGNRQMYEEIKRFESEFADFREHPTRPVKRGAESFSSGDIEFDSDSVEYDNMLWKATDTLLRWRAGSPR